MLRKTTLLCAMLLAVHATAGADKNADAPAEAAPAAPPAPLCIKDKKLEGVAGQLAELQRIPPSAELIKAAREAGVDANPVYAKFGVTGEFDSFKAWLEDLNETSDAPLICGRARSGERIVLVAAVRAGALTTAGRNNLHATVIDDFRDPYLVVRDSSGSSRRIAVDGGQLGSTISIPVEWGRPLFVQLVATGPNGPRPVAERWVGKIPEGPTTRSGSQSPEAWLMQLRRATGARSLRSNRLLSQEATSHAQMVCDSGRFGHELDPNGDPEARLLKRGIEARVVGEAVARAATMREALNAIADSPSHRMTVTDPRFTDAGYGKAEDEKGRTCAVILLASWPRKVP
ncbi:MAG: CAP domain-containing protein [Deltaproteobacteria bacterium]|nr:CAP domain-containing protein [Myxococcales bacterium]RZV53308.1 MAG: CAP domain-containing protein [Deltaproteobacteria bacterium]